MNLAQAVRIILNVLQGIFGIVTGIQTTQGAQATADAVGVIQTNVNTLLSNDLAQSADLASILAALGVINDAISTGFGDLAVDIADLSNGVAPVSLPVTPPTGYGAPAAGTVAQSVWEYQYPVASGNIMGHRLDQAGWMAENWSETTHVPFAYADLVGVHYDFAAKFDGFPTGSVPQPDPTTILASDTDRVAWLNRTLSAFHWEYLNNLVVSYTGASDVEQWWVCTLSELDFRQWQTLTPGGVSLAAPVWPGIANVTLGSPVTLTGATTVTGPMDGIIITLTGVPPDKPSYILGTQVATAHIGQVAFEDDNGDMEYPQNLSFANHVYSPQSMVSAEACMIRSIQGVTGTATPWTITP